MLKCSFMDFFRCCLFPGITSLCRFNLSLCTFQFLYSACLVKHILFVLFVSCLWGDCLLLLPPPPLLIFKVYHNFHLLVVLGGQHQVCVCVCM